MKIYKTLTSYLALTPVVYVPHTGYVNIQKNLWLLEKMTMIKCYTGSSICWANPVLHNIQKSHTGISRVSFASGRLQLTAFLSLTWCHFWSSPWIAVIRCPEPPCAALGCAPDARPAGWRRGRPHPARPETRPFLSSSECQQTVPNLYSLSSK